MDLKAKEASAIEKELSTNNVMESMPMNATKSAVEEILKVLREAV